MPKVIKKTPKKLGAEVSKKPQLNYHLEIQVNDLVYKGDATSLEQAFADFVKNPNFPSTIKTRALIRFGDKKTESQVVWPTVKARRQFQLMSLKPYWAGLLAGKFDSNLANA